MKNPKKIYILGVSGSGKTTLAKKISKKLKIPIYDLDDFFFIRKYDKKRTIEKRREKLKKLIKEKKEWIIEGVYHDWVSEAIKKAELLIWLNPGKNKISFRILKRYLMRKGKEKETFKDVLYLIKWSRKYNENDSKTYKKHNEFIKKHKKDTIILKNNKQTREFLNSIKL